jgi:hypothetical protein
MELKQQRVPTGTFCGGNHPEQIEYRYVLVNGEEVPHGPLCSEVPCGSGRDAGWGRRA